MRKNTSKTEQMPSKKKEKTLHFLYRMTRAEWETLKVFARQQELTRTEIIRNAITIHLKSHGVDFQHKTDKDNPNQLGIE